MGVAFSMTGFGRCLVENPVCRQQWEIRSVNGRYLDIKWKLPKMARPFEFQLEKTVKRHAARGRVEISLALIPGERFASKPIFDCATAKAMLEALNSFGQENGVAEVRDIGRLLLLPELWSEPQAEEDALFSRELQEGLAMALADWNQSRQAEGEALVDDLLSRVRLLKKWLDKLMEYAPLIKNERKDAFHRRVQESLRDYELDAARINQEIVLICDRFDATEELVRLGAHIGRLEDLLLNAGADLGRRLDFTLQECFREINTCGNKLQDSRVSEIVVNFKNELEKCREQTMNLE